MKKQITSTLFLTLTLISCSQPNRNWQREDVFSHDPNYASSHLSLPPDSDQDSLQVKLVQTKSGMNMYVDSIGKKLHIKPEAKVCLEIQTENSKEIIEGDCLEGGQRIVLPEDAKQKIIEKLLNGQQVHIAIDRAKTTIIPDNFNTVYN
jgi:hypothetical protein